MISTETDMFAISDDDFQAFQHLIYTETGISLGENKRCLLCSRLSKRLRALNLHDYLDYYDYLMRRDGDGGEMQQMINCITTNKTDFFREHHHFDFLTSRVFPEIVRRAATGGPRRLRIWSSASSLGHEPYSLAITTSEFPAFDASWDVRILASDIDTDVLKKAANGQFSLEDMEPVRDHIKSKYFLKGTGASRGQAKAKESLRQLLTFRQINLIDPSWPINAKFDVIFCRNVMIYFDRETQRRIIEHFISHLQPNGYLMLGHSENIHWTTKQFRPLGNTIFQLTSSTP